MKINKVFFAFFSLILLLSGCVESASNNGTKNGGASSGTKETFEWRMASVWAEGSIQYEFDKLFVETINELSDGAIDIKLHSVDQLAPANQVLDIVSDGTVEMGGDWPNYWSGKNTAFDLLGSQAVGFTMWDYFIWINHGGGQEVYQDIYGKFNTVYFPHTISGMESGIRSNKPINSLDDFKGMKIRMAGLIQSELTQQLGATPTTMATQEIYESLQRGVIDAAEFSTPYADEIMKLHEVTEYWLTPGWHQTSAIYGAIINEEAWNSLPDEYKNIFEKASKITMTLNTTEYAYSDAVSAKKMVEEYGIKTTELSTDEVKQIREMTSKIIDDLAKENEDFKMVLDSQMDFLEMYSSYRDLQGEWSFGTNLMLE